MERPNPARIPLTTENLPKASSQVPVVPRMPHRATSPAPEAATESRPEASVQAVPQSANQAVAQIMPKAAAQNIPRVVRHSEVTTVPPVSQAPAPAVAPRETREADPTIDTRKPLLAADPEPQPPSQPQATEMRPKSSYSQETAQSPMAQSAVAALTYAYEHTSGGFHPLLSEGHGTGSRESAALSHIGTASDSALSASFPSGNGAQWPGNSGSEAARAAGSGLGATTSLDLHYADDLPHGRGASAAKTARSRIPDTISQQTMAFVSPAAIPMEGRKATPATPPSVPLVKSIGDGVNPPRPNQVMVSEDVVPQVSPTRPDRVLIPAAPDSTNLAAIDKALAPPKKPVDIELTPETVEPLAVTPPLPRPAGGLGMAEGTDSDSTLEGAEISPGSLEVIRQVKPQYPTAALRQGKEGVTKLLVKVSPDGVPQEAVIAVSSGRWDLDNSALEAVKQWLFTPYPETAETDGLWVTVQIHFRLND